MPVQATSWMPVRSATSSMNCAMRPPNIAVGSTIVVTPWAWTDSTCSTASAMLLVGVVEGRPLLRHGLVDEAHVLVDAGAAERVGLDRPGHGLDLMRPSSPRCAGGLGDDVGDPLRGVPERRVAGLLERQKLRLGQPLPEERLVLVLGQDAIGVAPGDGHRDVDAVEPLELALAGPERSRNVAKIGVSRERLRHRGALLGAHAIAVDHLVAHRHAAEAG